MKKMVALVLLCLIAVAAINYKTIVRLYEGHRLEQTSKERANYYKLNDGVPIRDITQRLLEDKTIPDDLKTELASGERRIVVFKYASGKNNVAGYISYLVHGEHPALVFLRGGNGFFGIMRPNNRFSFITGYNVVGTLYRGNIYGGKDELGGADIEDVENLIKSFPQLESFIHKQIRPPFVMMGVSRGAMEMFIALSRSNILKSQVSHAISVSGNLDLFISKQERPEMDYLFWSKFKESHEKNFDAWLSKRDPSHNVKGLAKGPKVLLVYGLADGRVSLAEQESFKKSLDGAGISAALITVPNAGHGLDGHFAGLQKIIGHFLKNDIAPMPPIFHNFNSQENKGPTFIKK